MTFNQFADALRSDPGLDLSSRVGANNDDASTLTMPRIDTTDVEETFSFKWTSLKDTARDTAASVLKIEGLKA